jgi:HTH-type transcriptional regulator/antitoxin HigA
MTPKVARVPAVSFHPGEFLKDALDDLGWSQTELAEIIGRAPRVINEIVLGKRGITPDTAKEFAAALGTSAQYWLNLETAYQLSKAAPVPDRIAHEAELRRHFPVKDMAKRGWLEIRDGDDTGDAISKYFGIASPSASLDNVRAAWRRGGAEVSTTQLAWLVRVRQIAEAFPTERYSESRLRDALVSLEALLTEPEEVRHVPRILAECGVRFIVVEPLPSSKIDGVCFWLDKNRSPVIGLSLKGSDQIDRFWFNLRHEIEHVLRCDGRDSPVIDNFEDVDKIESESEKAANAAAADFCVPKTMMDSFIKRHHPIYSKSDLIGFSRLVHRHPGIVAGQIQKKLDRWDLFKQYQVKIRHIVTKSALTDGYGVSPQIQE